MDFVLVITPSQLYHPFFLFLGFIPTRKIICHNSYYLRKKNVNPTGSSSLRSFSVLSFITKLLEVAMIPDLTFYLIWCPGLLSPGASCPCRWRLHVPSHSGDVCFHSTRISELYSTHPLPLKVLAYLTCRQSSLWVFLLLQWNMFLDPRPVPCSVYLLSAGMPRSWSQDSFYVHARTHILVLQHQISLTNLARVVGKLTGWAKSRWKISTI